LEYRHPDFEFSEEVFKMTELSGQKARQLLLEKKHSDPKITLKNLLLHFHYKLAQDRNSHFAVCEVLLHYSLPLAEKLDKEVTTDNAHIYPLFGHVLSVKENILMKGTKSTCGLYCNQGLTTEDTPFIDYLASLGAIFISKGNVPLMLFAMESHNNLYGCCQNPHDRTRTPGGSSGGEAVMVSMKTCNSGIGNDIAGSLRIPSNFCGIFCLLITPSRMSGSIGCGPFQKLTFTTR
jgi:Asp-tRNA(Asn)/Glu-tRNA(Gln) amidotransferase A subunit family amidase